jgi:hypothetical protein
MVLQEAIKDKTLEVEKKFKDEQGNLIDINDEASIIAAINKP